MLKSTPRDKVAKALIANVHRANDHAPPLIEKPSLREKRWRVPVQVCNPGLELAFSVVGSGERDLKRVMVLHIEPGVSKVTENKKTVSKYLEGFNKSDHEQILSCLTEDVEWEMPGAFHLFGKTAFDKEIENDAFVGSPTITITRMIEENDVVVAEGRVRVKRKGGGFLNAVFCDVFILTNARIKLLTTYLTEIKS